MFGRELARELLAGTADALIPVYLNLGFARNRPDFLQAIADYVARYGVSASREQWTDLLLNEPTVLLLDGFDELAGWMDYRQIPELLERIRGLQVGPDVRIVLSGRSSFSDPTSRSASSARSTWRNLVRSTSTAWSTTCGVARRTLRRKPRRCSNAIRTSASCAAIRFT